MDVKGEIFVFWSLDYFWSISRFWFKVVFDVWSIEGFFLGLEREIWKENLSGCFCYVFCYFWFIFVEIVIYFLMFLSDLILLDKIE